MIIFVYGTLKQNHANHYFLNNSSFLGQAKTYSNKYTLHNLGFYPALIPEGTTTVQGEAYEINELTLQKIHKLEGHPTFYKANNIYILLNNKKTKATTYFFQHAANNPIPSGNWPK